MPYILCHFILAIVPGFYSHFPSNGLTLLISLCGLVQTSTVFSMKVKLERFACYFFLYQIRKYVIKTVFN